jgi:hypothetical protein
MGAICTPVLAFVSTFASIKMPPGYIGTPNLVAKIELHVIKERSPFEERIEIVRNCRHADAAYAAVTDDKLEIWRDLRFSVFFKGEIGRGPKRASTSNGSSRKAASRWPISHIRRRRPAVGCA